MDPYLTDSVTHPLKNAEARLSVTVNLILSPSSADQVNRELLRGLRYVLNLAMRSHSHKACRTICCTAISADWSQEI